MEGEEFSSKYSSCAHHYNSVDTFASPPVDWPLVLLQKSPETSFSSPTEWPVSRNVIDVARSEVGTHDPVGGTVCTHRLMLETVLTDLLL